MIIYFASFILCFLCFIWIRGELEKEKKKKEREGKKVANEIVWIEIKRVKNE